MITKAHTMISGTLHITLNRDGLVLKQGNDLIRLTRDEARELAEDLAEILPLIPPCDSPSRTCDLIQVA